jgi:hypothetical protein
MGSTVRLCIITSDGVVFQEQLDTSNSCNEAHVHVTPHVFLSLHVAWVLDNIGRLKEQLVISKAYQLERDKYAKSMRKVTQCGRRMQGVRYA